MKPRSSRKGDGTPRGVVLLAVLLLASLVLALVSFFHVQRWAGYSSQYLSIAADEQILAQRMARYGVAAIQGDASAFKMLREARTRFDKEIGRLKKGGNGLPPSPPEVSEPLSKAEEAWLGLREEVDKILGSQDAILNVDRLTRDTTGLIPKLYDTTNAVVQHLLDTGASSRQVYQATLQLMLAERIANNLRLVLEGGDTTLTAIDRFSQDADRFGQVLDAMRNGNDHLGISALKDKEARKVLSEATEVFAQVRDNATKLVALAPDVLPALDSVNRLNRASDELSDVLERLIAAYRSEPGRLTVLGYRVGPFTVLILGGLSVIFLIIMGGQLLLHARRREEESRAINEANQKAILTLLDEMGDLADGDLTVQATVTEDITGAIADSINYAIEALRNLVTTINGTSEKVSGASQETRATAMHLAEASEMQTQQITQTTSAIKEMTEAMEQMTKDAKESADVAQRSVEIAGKGGATVRNTIRGMDTIREQIQETSKRIKRLGESSQEIGDIVELIDDIADQTNILALNAAMQAAMAGEAGRGFAVVADEVQRLAERSSNATKQIEALVKTIQADTNEAVASMEASTSGVVSGAKLAEEAGAALLEIENVSNYIADLTRKIADSAERQSLRAGEVDTNMTVIQEITTQTAEGTRETAAKVGELVDLAVELQRTVAGFRLPA